jgi:hypothetical protein
MRNWIKTMMAKLIALLLTRENIMALFSWAGPLVLEMIRKRMNAEDQAKLPTEAELKADLESNADVYLAEGKDWLKTFPAPPGG